MRIKILIVSAETTAVEGMLHLLYDCGAETKHMDPDSFRASVGQCPYFPPEYAEWSIVEVVHPSGETFISTRQNRWHIAIPALSRDFENNRYIETKWLKARDTLFLVAPAPINLAVRLLWALEGFRWDQIVQRAREGKPLQ